MKISRCPLATYEFLRSPSPTIHIKSSKVATTTSDVVLWALAATCDSFASIYIHPPQNLGGWKLHIHVEPRYPFQVIGQSELMSGQRNILGSIQYGKAKLNL